MRKVRKALAIGAALLAVGGVTTATATVANAYQAPGSSWTWHWYDNVAAGPSGMQHIFEDTYDLSTGCSHFNVNGHSWIDRGGPGNDGQPVQSVRLDDSWEFANTLGSASISLGGPGISTGAETLNWSSGNGGDYMEHNYQGGFEVGTGGWFYSVNHTSNGFVTIGGAEYLMQTVRSEGLC